MIIQKIGKVDEKLYSSIGGKAKGLDELAKAGFNVPKGFIITDISNINAEDEKTLLKAFQQEPENRPTDHNHVFRRPHDFSSD